jgi:hypothetical protein
VLVGQLPPYPFGLLTIGKVGGDAVDLAVLGQCLDGVVDLDGVLSDDDGGAAGGHDVGGGLASHSAAAADDDQFLPGEDGHGLRPDGPVRVTVQVLEPVPAPVHRNRSFRFGGGHRSTVRSAGPRSNPPMAGHDR